MSGSIAAPTGADVSSASSSATTTTTPSTTSTTSTPSTSTKPQSAGKPSRNSITKSLKDKRAEKAKTEPADADVVDAKAQLAGALGADEVGKKPEGETANPEAGKGDEKPKGNGDLPPWMRERLSKEKDRREKLETDLHASKTNEAKLRHVVDVAVQENERLTGMLAKAGLIDERGEELQALKVQQAAKEKFATIEQEGTQALAKSRSNEQIVELARQMKAACDAACVEFPLVSAADLKASLRENPRADIHEVARALHEQRMAFRGKQAPTAALQAAPTTVGKPTGTSRNLPPLSAKGMTLAVKSARARS